jgi:hypothetical protein
MIEFSHAIDRCISPEQLEPDPIEIDPRPCELCGLTIDKHERVDTPEGPEFFCLDFLPDEMTLDELERRAELRRQEEVAAILARWEAMDAMDGPSKAPPPRAPEPYRPAQSTVDAFRYLVAIGDVGRLREWLADRPKDAPLLLAMLESLAPC